VTGAPGAAFVVGVDFVMPRSAVGGGVTVVVAVAALLAGVGSEASLLPDTVFVIEPETAVTFTTTVNDADAPLASDAIEQLIVPVPPTAGVVQLQPPGEVIDWNVTPEPIDSVIFALAAASGPWCVLVWVVCVF
jgi:hypothetical protein